MQCAQASWAGRCPDTASLGTLSTLHPAWSLMANVVFFVNLNFVFYFIQISIIFTHLFIKSYQMQPISPDPHPPQKHISLTSYTSNNHISALFHHKTLFFSNYSQDILSHHNSSQDTREFRNEEHSRYLPDFSAEAQRTNTYESCLLLYFFSKLFVIFFIIDCSQIDFQSIL